MNKTELVNYIAVTIVDYVCDEYEIDADENGWDETVNYLRETLATFSEFDLEVVCNKLDELADEDNEDDDDNNYVWNCCNHLYLYLTYCYEHDVAEEKWLSDWCY